ncbi:MAG: DUF3124 domain-containing protein [Bacteroidota bacterium]
MRQLVFVCFLCCSLLSCTTAPEENTTDPINWSKRIADTPLVDSLKSGGTYLSVYSQIYSMTELRTHNLTVTVSMRNTNQLDTVYLNKAEFYNTKGSLIRTYFDSPIFLTPMETLHIVIDATDNSGGTGANFIFEWSVKPNTREPLFEAIMISTLGQQGLSFSTQGQRIY